MSQPSLALALGNAKIDRGGVFEDEDEGNGEGVKGNGCW